MEYFRIDKALDSLDFNDWLEQYTDILQVSDYEIRLKECPKCGKDKYKLYVNTENRLFYCFHCHFGEGISDICMLMSEISGIHINTLKVELAKSVPPSKPQDILEVLIKEKLQAKEEKEEYFPISPAAIPGDTLYNKDGVIVKKAIKYLKSRGLSEESVKEYDLRVVNRLNDLFGPFLVFPVYYYNIPVSWQGRRLINKEPRYISNENINNWLWPLNKKIEKKSIVLVEGVFDALGFKSLGIPSLCTFGKKISINQIILLSNLKIEKVILAWDPEAVNEIIKAVEKLKAYFDVFILNYSQKEQDLDPGDILTSKKALSFFGKLLKSPINIKSEEYYRWKLLRKWS